MEKIIQKLSSVNWDFSDYNSIKYPLDINSIPWYPATFPAPIPKYLVALLSEKDDCVLDPFGGKGTTIFESIKQGRTAIYNDINPFASDMVKSLIESIKFSAFDENSISNIIEEDKIKLKNVKRNETDDTYSSELINNKMKEDNFKKRFEIFNSYNILEDVFYWFHFDTLLELLEIYKLIQESDSVEKYIRKMAFISILKETSSQRGHFTYVTDNCKPKILKYNNALISYYDMLDRIRLSTCDFLQRFSIVNNSENVLSIIDKTIIHEGDARTLNWIDSESVDLVVTSPPYLCAQDYTKTMRLINLFFPNDDFGKIASNEIGPRSQRNKKSEVVVSGFYDDLKKVFSEIYRVLKEDKYFCLVIGQGSGKITQSYDTIKDLTNILTEEIGFEEVFNTIRYISHKTIRIGGVETEKIIILKK